MILHKAFAGIVVTRPSNSTGKVTFSEGELARVCYFDPNVEETLVQARPLLVFPPLEVPFSASDQFALRRFDLRKGSLPRVNFVHSGGKPLARFASHAD